MTITLVKKFLESQSSLSTILGQFNCVDRDINFREKSFTATKIFV